MKFRTRRVSRLLGAALLATSTSMIAAIGADAAEVNVGVEPASVILAQAAGAPAPSTPVPAEAPAGAEPATAIVPGYAEMLAVCSNCHGGPITARRSDVVWDRLWSQMLAYGMSPQPRETREIVLTYLKTYMSTEREPPATTP